MVTDKLKAYLWENRVSVRDLAAGTGIPESELSDELAEGGELDLAHYALVCGFLGVPVDRFAGQESPLKRKS